MPTAPLAFPLLGVPRAPGNKTNPHKGYKSLGGWPPEAGGKIQLPRLTRPDPHCSQHGRLKCDPTTGEAQCYYSRRSCCDWDYDCAEETSDDICHMRTSPPVGDITTFIILKFVNEEPVMEYRVSIQMVMCTFICKFKILVFKLNCYSISIFNVKWGLFLSI